LKEEVLPLIQELQSEIEKSFFIKKISEMTNISEKYIISDLEKIPLQEKRVSQSEENKNTVNSVESPSYNVIEKQIWGIYVNKDKSENTKKDIVDIVGEEEFLKIENKYKDKESEFIFDENDYSATEEETFKNFKNQFIRKKILHLKENIDKAEREGDEKTADELTKELALLGKEKDIINNSRHNFSN